MKLYALINSNWLEWPLAIREEMAERHSVCQLRGLVTGERHVYERVRQKCRAGHDHVEWLDDLERQWLATPYDHRRIAHYEELLGVKTIKRIIIADRQIGHGFITGGNIPRTPLVEICRDYEMVRRYVVNMLDYLADEFTTNKPDLILTHAVAGAHTFAAGCLAEVFGVPFVQLASTRIGSSVVMERNTITTLSDVQATYHAAIHDQSVVEECRNDAAAYLQEFRQSYSVPLYAERGQFEAKKNLLVQKLLRNFLADLLGSVEAMVRRQPTPLRKQSRPRLGAFRASKWFAARRALSDNSFVSGSALPFGDFAYFPLHVDPEASTMVLSPGHTDQRAVLEMIAKQLPLGWNLVVKEHHPMLGFRPRGFYASLKTIPGVVLVSPFEDGMDLLRRSSLVTTITGTIGWEALLVGKPLVVFGETHYAAIKEGLVRCPNLQQLDEAIAQALSLPPASDEHLVLFIASLLKHSIDFPGTLIWDRQTAELVRQNKNIVTNLCDELDKRLDAHDPTGFFRQNRFCRQRVGQR